MGGFFVVNATISKISFVNCDLWPFRNSKSYFEWTLLSVLNYGSLYSWSVSRLRKDKTSFGIFWFQKLQKILDLNVSVVFHVTVNYFFWSYCMFSRCSIGLSHRRVVLFPSSITKFQNSPADSVPLSMQNFLGRFFFVIMFKNAFAVSFASFCLFRLHLLFNQTSVDELVKVLNECFLLPVYQQNENPYTNFQFWI